MSSGPALWAQLRAGERDLRLEYRWISPGRRRAPLIVFLHQGLGSMTIWDAWPQRLCDALDCRGLVYSRYGYGRSTPRPAGEKWPFDYMHEEAAETLPALLRAVGVDAARERPILFGHSDGGTIALIHAALYPEAVGAIVCVAPHIHVEDVGLARIRKSRAAYPASDLQRKLARYHAHPDQVFWGWSDLWVDPNFRTWNIEALLPRIRCPVLAVQGVGDEYGTLAQIHGIRSHAPHTELLVLGNCRHSPHQDQPQRLIEGVENFFARLAASR